MPESTPCTNLPLANHGRLAQRLARCFHDYRDPRRCEHLLQHLVAQRLFRLVLGYEDINDHDQIRADSVLALAVLLGNSIYSSLGGWKGMAEENVAAADDGALLTAKTEAMASAAEPRQGLVTIKSRAGEGGDWVPSPYSTRAQTQDDMLVLYNSDSGVVAGLREPHSDRVCKPLQQAGVHLESLEELPVIWLKEDFSFRPTANELQCFRLRFLQYHQGPDRLELTLPMSEGCSFRCQYCHESLPRGTIEPWVREVVIRPMETRAPRLNWLSVSYFGGEPLLGMEAVEETAPAAQKTAAVHSIQYDCSITTNGYLPTGEVFEKLVGWNLRQCQITLDGERECDDHSRPLKDGASTFDRILENLRTIKLTAHDFKVTLCGNFTPVNLCSMRSFLEEIGDFKDDKSFSIRFFLPVCQGSSCPLPRLELRKRPCPPQRLHIGKTLTNIWQQKEGKGRLYSIQDRDFVARSHVEDSGPATM